MKGSEDPEFKRNLKEMILKETQRDMDPEEIPDDAYIVGSDTILELDSLDVLQVSIAIQNQYGIRIEDSKDARRIYETINTLADYLRPQ